MTSVETSVGRRPVYLVIAAISLGAALIGFAPTFFLPMARQSFHAPPIVFIHGALAFAWVVLFFTQPALIRAGNYGLHIRLGVLGVVLALALAGTGIAVGSWSVTRDLAGEMGEAAVSNIVGIFATFTMFLALVGAGVANRKTPEVHKRFMLLATVLVTWPAWFRFRHFFPAAPHPEILFAFVPVAVLMLAVMAADWRRLGRVHPVYAVWGTAIIAEQVVEIWLYDSPGWRVVGQALYALAS